jgi:hypothetical protein
MAEQYWFRTVDSRYPFLWDSAAQPPWGVGEGIDRDLRALPVDLDAEAEVAEPALDDATLRGGLATYPTCRRESRRLRERGATALLAPSAALVPAGASGELVELVDLVPAPPRDGRVLALFGSRPGQRGHRCVERGRPPRRVLALTAPL